MNPETLSKVTYGMYIVSGRKGEKFNGQIVNTVIQVTAQPCQVALVVNKKNLTHDYIQSGKAFSISILSQSAPLEFIGRFGFKSGREVDKFKLTKHQVGAGGVPIVTEWAIGYIECQLVDSVDTGTHTIFIGLVTGAEVKSDEPPMTYAYYHDVKRGKTHQNAPTFVKEGAGKEAGTMDSYRCTICNYVYDPAKGDPDSNVKPGTPFEALPGDWVCPVCGAGKDKFVKEE